MAGDQLCGTVGAKGGQKTANPWRPLKTVEILAKINVSGWAKNSIRLQLSENHRKPLVKQRFRVVGRKH